MIFAALVSACTYAFAQLLRVPTLPLVEGATYPLLLDVEDTIYPWGTLVGLVYFFVLHRRGGTRAVMLTSCSMLAASLCVRGLWPNPSAFPWLWWAQRTAAFALPCALIIEGCLRSSASDWRARFGRFITLYLVTELASMLAGLVMNVPTAIANSMGLGTHEMARIMCGVLLPPTVLALFWSARIWPTSSPTGSHDSPATGTWQSPWQLWIGASLACWFVLQIYSLLRLELYATLDPLDAVPVTTVLPVARLAGPLLIWQLARSLTWMTAERAYAAGIVLCGALAVVTFSFEANVEAGVPLSLLFAGAIFCQAMLPALLPNSPGLIAAFFVVQTVLAEAATQLLALGILDFEVEFWAQVLMALALALLCQRWPVKPASDHGRAVAPQPR